MTIETGIPKHIPSKVSKTKDNLPYITPEIDKLIKEEIEHTRSVKRHNITLNILP